MRMVARSKQPEVNEKESETLPALTVQGDYVLDFCLERDSYDSRYCKTSEFSSVLIDGRRRWFGQKQTYAINNPFQFISQYEHNYAMACSYKRMHL